MGAYAKAKELGREAVLEKIDSLGICETGVYREKMTDHLKAAEEAAAKEGEELCLVAALNNADTDCVFLELVKKDPEKIIEGCAIAAIAAGTEKAALVLPEKEEELAASLREKAAPYGVEVRNEFINIRRNACNALIHLAACADLTDAFNDCYVPGIYVSVNGGELQKLPEEKKISELADLSEAKAVQVGYRYFTAEECEASLGQLYPANGMIRVLTQKDCIVDDTQKKLHQSRTQSCGKCVFCREGLIQLEFMQTEITAGRGKGEFADLTKEIGEAMCYSTPCSMGQQCAGIALSAMGKFPDEYEAHIKKKSCPAGVCKAFIRIYVDPSDCTGCGDCLDVCPKNCIEGKPKYIHMIDEIDCDRCGKCVEACEEECIHITTGKVPKLPDRLTKVGKFKKKRH